jgi:hypothetical protein
MSTTQDRQQIPLVNDRFSAKQELEDLTKRFIIEEKKMANLNQPVAYPIFTFLNNSWFSSSNSILLVVLRQCISFNDKFIYNKDKR